MIAAGVLGSPFRVVYTAKNFAPGLIGIQLKVIRPDREILGPFDMAEFNDSILSGVYYFDFETQPIDPIGDYIVVISNPEQSHKEGLRIRYNSVDTLETLSTGLSKHYFGG